MVYAKILNDTVVNLIEIRQVNAHEFPDCVPTNDIPAEIGDTYKDGFFFRDGEKVLSAEMRAAEAEAQLETADEEATAEALAILSGEVTE